jgi:hypothetical protein
MKLAIVLLILFFCSILCAGGGGDFYPTQDQKPEQEHFSPSQQVYPNTGTLPVIVIKDDKSGFNWLWTTVIIPLVIAYVGIRMSAKKNKKA